MNCTFLLQIESFKIWKHKDVEIVKLFKLILYLGWTFSFFLGWREGVLGRGEGGEIFAITQVLFSPWFMQCWQISLNSLFYFPTIISKLTDFNKRQKDIFELVSVFSNLVHICSILFWKFFVLQFKRFRPLIEFIMILCVGRTVFYPPLYCFGRTLYPAWVLVPTSCIQKC